MRLQIDRLLVGCNRTTWISIGIRNSSLKDVQGGIVAVSEIRSESFLTECLFCLFMGFANVLLLQINQREIIRDYRQSVVIVLHFIVFFAFIRKFLAADKSPIVTSSNPILSIADAY